MNILEAKQQAAIAQRNLAAVSAVLTGAVEREAQLKRAAEIAAAAELEAGVDDVLQHAAVRRDAETIAAAATRAVAAAQQAHSNASSRLKAAEDTQRNAINVILAAEGDEIVQRMAGRAARFEVDQKADQAILVAMRDVGVPMTRAISSVICDDLDTPLCDLGRPGPFDIPINQVDQVRSSEAGETYVRDRISALLADSAPTAQGAAA